MSRYIKPILILLVAIFSVYIAEKRTDGFRTPKVQFQYNTKWNVSLPSKKQKMKIDAILSQDFYYLGRGRQFFVFKSSDGKYVLKLLNQNNIFYPKILDYFKSFGFVKKIINRKNGKIPLTFSSLKLSYEDLKSETKLLYVNLCDEKVFDRKAKIFTKHSQVFDIDLTKSIYVIQKKVDNFGSYLEKNKSDTKKTNQIIESYLQLIKNRCLKLIADDDLNCLENIGVLNNKSVIVDSGRLFYDKTLLDDDNMKKEMYLATKFLRKWLLNNQLYDSYTYLQNRIELITD